MVEKQKIKVGVSVGDLNGIGIEVILKTFKDNRMMDFCTPIIFGGDKVISQYKKSVGLQDINLHLIKTIKESNPRRIKN